MSNAPSEQHRPDGTLRHLLTLDSLSRGEIEHLLDRAQSFVVPLGQRPRPVNRWQASP